MDGRTDQPTNEFVKQSMGIYFTLPTEDCHVMDAWPGMVEVEDWADDRARRTSGRFGSRRASGRFESRGAIWSQIRPKETAGEEGISDINGRNYQGVLFS